MGGIGSKRTQRSTLVIKTFFGGKGRTLRLGEIQKTLQRKNARFDVKRLSELTTVSENFEQSRTWTATCSKGFARLLGHSGPCARINRSGYVEGIQGDQVFFERGTTQGRWSVVREAVHHDY